MLNGGNNPNYRKIFFFIALLSCLFAYAIVFKNYYVMVIPVTIIIGTFILRSNVISISIILFIVFFGQSLEHYGFLPEQVNWLNELILLMLFLKAIFSKLIKREKVHLKYIWVIVSFLFLSFISLLINPISPLSAFLFFRLILRYYFLFIAIINLDLDETAVRLINNIIIILFIIQIPTAVVKMFIFGQGEQAIGTYAPWGGGPSTIIPMLTISFILSFYFFYKQSNIFILLAFGFIAFGLIGGKRGILIFVPLLILFMGFMLKNQGHNILKYSAVLMIMLIITISISILVLPSLNPSEQRGEIDLNFLWSYLSDYTVRSSEGESAGRISTTIRVINVLKAKGLYSFLFGLGPGSYIQTRFENIQNNLLGTGALQILYGLTGFCWLALQIGFIGAIVYLLLFYYILCASFRYFKLEVSPYWKSLMFGMVGFSFVMLIISLAYNIVIINDMIPMVYFYLAGVTYRRYIDLESKILLAEAKDVEIIE